MKKKSGPVELGKVVRKLRMEKGYSQEELAYRANLHRNYLGAIERGERNIGLQTLVVIAHVLGMKASKLLEKASL